MRRTQTTNATFGALVLFGYFFPGCFPALAGTEALTNNTLLCSQTMNGYVVNLNIYVTKDRAFAYYGSNGETSKLGTIYEFGREKAGRSGANSYKSKAQISPAQIKLNNTVVNRSCRICDGKTIMQSEQVVISQRGDVWVASRSYRQWFPDGTAAAVPSGSETYRCKVGTGRIGVGE